MSPTRHDRRFALQLALGAALLPVLGSARAQTPAYPSRLVRVIVGFAPGGPLDVVTRLVARELTDALGQPFVVENRAGASGQLATDAVAAATPDGYTLMSTASTFIVNPLLIDRKQPDPLRDFVAISHMAVLPTVLVVGKDFPANNLGELLTLARKRTLTYSSAGNGGPAHLAGALLAQTHHSPMTHIPMRGAAPALMEVMSGRVDFTFYTMTGLKEQVDGGKLKPIAITAARRHPLFPQVPTMAEAGAAGFDQVGAWFGLVAPAGTPPAVVELLARTVDQILRKPSSRAVLDGLGVLPVGGSPAAFRSFLETDTLRWGPLIKEAGIKGE